MSDPIRDTQRLAETSALTFRDCGGGHVQISGHGILVNYWPLSKRRTAHPNGGAAVHHCQPWDAVKLALGAASLAPKGVRELKNKPSFPLDPVRTNPAGIRWTYTGSTPPWSESFGRPGDPIIMCESDNIRIRAMRLRDEADAMDAA